MGLFDFLKPQSGSGNISDSDRLFLTAKGGIVELKRAYKDLSDKGKFEVILFNSLTVLRVYRENHPSRYASIEEGFYKAIFNQAKTYGIAQNPEQLMNFINSRFQFYAQELENIYEGGGYIPGKIYSAFYLTPLAKDPEPSFDLGEIMKFFMGLTTMIKWVHDNTNKI